MQTSDLVLEILTEEIPARMQAKGAQDLKESLVKLLHGNGLEAKTSDVYYTARRITFHLTGLPVVQADREEEKRGPRVGAPEQAVQGFLKSVGLSSTDECLKLETEKGEFWFSKQTIRGQRTQDVLPSLIQKMIETYTWPKSMRWGANSLAWVRPIQSIMCVFEGKAVPGQLDLGTDQLQFQNHTVGHRFHAPDAILCHDFEGYKESLKAAYVVLDQDERKQMIKNQALTCAAGQSVTLLDDEGLLNEVTGLVEWPNALMGTIEPEFMELPREVLTTSMRVHQKYFAMEKQTGTLAPYFITISNISPEDGGDSVLLGNNRVLKARLADAKFFFDLDKQTSLEDHGKGLANLVFHEELGAISEKVKRLEGLTTYLAEQLGQDAKQAAKAAQLCKSDLTTEMVGEFPELQGVMGYYYAGHEGQPKDVCSAIRDHYSPKGPSDKLPETNLGQALSLADKIDTLVGFFAVGIKPTGSKDPYALRRAALGCIRLMEDMSLSLEDLVEQSYLLYVDIFKNAKSSLSLEKVQAELRAFFNDRLKVYWRDQGYRHDYISAVLEIAKGDPIPVLNQRLKALQDFLSDDEGENLLVAYRRASNIVRIEEGRDKIVFDADVNPDLLKAAQENNLYSNLNKALPPIQAAVSDQNFKGAMEHVAGLLPHINSFFDEVVVNDDNADIRVNRLRLLSLIRSTLHQVADFSKIEG